MKAFRFIVTLVAALILSLAVYLLIIESAHSVECFVQTMEDAHESIDTRYSE